ncbi:hypothetical protein Pcinc_031638 [Petrolisthes cinctipes]|uniref:Uncharacterized protein n=1 Tax=Petrolisthes cinctipes TaxID=88211 RepID=A0AAE1EW75_PETCI|nr:hypothetical protein Pcinc_031638 [Petrolisthes cinctipes]
MLALNSNLIPNNFPTHRTIPSQHHLYPLSHPSLSITPQPSPFSHSTDTTSFSHPSSSSPLPSSLLPPFIILSTNTTTHSHSHLHHYQPLTHHPPLYTKVTFVPPSQSPPLFPISNS